MPSRKSIPFLILSLMACAACAVPAWSQTVDQLLATDAQRAAANEKAAAEKAEKAAREAAGLPPAGVVAAAAAKPAHHRVFDLVSILGLTGQRKVVFKVDGRQIELNEPGGESKGFRLLDVDGTCATVGDVQAYKVERHHKRQIRTSVLSTHTVCYVQPIQFMSQAPLRMGVGGPLPAPVPLGALPPAPVLSQVYPPAMPRPAGFPPASVPGAGPSPVMRPTVADGPSEPQ